MIRRFVPTEVETNVEDTANFYCGIFCLHAATTYDDINDKIAELNITLDDLEGLYEKHGKSYEAQRAVCQGLKDCWDNLPSEQQAQNIIKPRIIYAAAIYGAELKKG